MMGLVKALSALSLGFVLAVLPISVCTLSLPIRPILTLSGHSIAGPQEPREVKVKDRTGPILATMTPAQKIHADLYPGLKGPHRLLDQVISRSLISDLRYPGQATPRSKDELVRRMTCNSDVAVRATVTDAASFPTSDGAFLFTDYDLRVLDVYHARPGLDLSNRRTIVYTLPGGEIETDAGVVRASLSWRPKLELQGEYIVFAEHLAATGALRSFSGDDGGVLSVHGETTSTLVSQPTAEGNLRDGVSTEWLADLLRRISCQHGADI